MTGNDTPLGFDFSGAIYKAVRAHLAKVAGAALDAQVREVRKALEADAVRCVDRIVRGLQVVQEKHPTRAGAIEVQINLSIPKEDIVG